MDILHEGSDIYSPWKNWLDRWFYWLLAAGILVNASGLLLPVLEPDGALYATISKNMVLSGDYINMKVQGFDWLDKPHFPFWITALSFNLFGINSFAYKFPGILFWMAGAYYTYAFAKKLYDRQTARLSVLIYLSAEHLIISNNDVRAEPYLTGLIIAATYFYYRSYIENKWIYILPGSLFLGMATMTKGIFIPAMVFSGFIAEWLIKKKWTEFINLRWWLAILLLFVFITPELYCLYIQFDQHPEKIIFGKTHVSGIRFFFWDSQFGRFFNTGPIKGKGDLLFYVHTILWAFLPWSVFAILLVFSKLKKINQPNQITADYICSGIFVTGFIIFSLSRFQLPHYINILYPFLSVMVAQYIMNLKNPVQQKIILYAQNILYLLFFLSCITLIIIFGLPNIVGVTIIILAIGIILYRLFPGNNLENIIGRSFSAVLVVNLLLNCLVYPELFKYQSGNAAAAFLKKNNHPGTVYTISGISSEYAFEFYAAQPVFQLNRTELNSLKDNVLVFTLKIELDSLRKDGFTINEIRSFPHFHISQLTGTFINHHTRYRVVDSVTLATIYPKK
ncbi:MAG TPA: glycosyltransferase family 39 protein [Puia sp.]|nr:glycosyltransferase family 39 protein [Puia sp.]